MEESILKSIKKLLGISEDDDSFNADILMHINTVFMTLSQLGIGPEEGFRIEDEDAEWSEYISEDSNLEAVKSYIHLKVKMLFDPPLNSTVANAINESIKELEWRLSVAEK